MQYEFCHHLLERVLAGVAGGGVASKGERKTSKWRLFQGKSSNKEAAAAGKSNNTGTAGKQNKTKKKKQSKVS